MKYKEAYDFLTQKLEQELPSYLTYHNAEHTKEVIRAAEHLVHSEKSSHHDIEIILTAALFHDSGFLEGTTDHEELSCQIARAHLVKFDYSQEQIEKICELIMATKLPQTPGDKGGEILCDADLYYLGTDKYFFNAENLFLEMKEMGAVSNWKEWEERQRVFLSSHKYFTETAKRECNIKKDQHLSKLNSRKQESSQEKKTIKKYTLLQDIFLITFGVLFASFALKGFLVPNNFIDGGISGMSLLLHKLYHFNLGIIIIVANLPFIVMGYFTVSHKFAYKTFFCVLLLGICLFFPYPAITSDKLLISIFGGFFLGIGIGLTMRAGCALDGIDVLALYTWKRTSFTVTEIILAINVLIFSIAAFQFGIESALYSMLTFFTASKTIDYVVEGLEAYTGVTIISAHSELIKHRLVNELGRGITVYKGERGFLPGKFEISNKTDIIFTVITRLELRKLKNLVQEIDPNAFVFANTIKDASGGIIKRRHIH